MAFVPKKPIMYVGIQLKQIGYIYETFVNNSHTKFGQIWIMFIIRVPNKANLKSP